MTDMPLEPGDVASVSVVFIEDRNGRALVRLPNGSKTSIDYGALRKIGGPAHFAADPDGGAVTVFCQRCDWQARRPSRTAAEDAYSEHLAAHEPS